MSKCICDEMGWVEDCPRHSGAQPARGTPTPALRPPNEPLVPANDSYDENARMAAPQPAAHPLGPEFHGCFAEKGHIVHVGECSVCAPTPIREGAALGEKIVKQAGQIFELQQELAALRKERDALRESAIELGYTPSQVENLLLSVRAALGSTKD